MLTIRMKLALYPIQVTMLKIKKNETLMNQVEIMDSNTLKRTI